MKLKGKPTEPRDVTPATPVNVEEVLQPFHEAATRFVQSHVAAQEAAFRQHAQALLDYQDRVRQVEQDAYRGVAEATRRYLDQFGTQAEGASDRVFAARAQAQSDYENEIRRIQAESQQRLADVTQKWVEECDKGEPAQQLSKQRQDAYQKYLADLQQAWSSTPAQDPQAMSAIASHILSTIQAVSQTG